MPDVGGDPQQQQESSDPFAGVDWDAVKKQLIEMGPPPQPPMYTGETDHPMFKYPAMDPVFDPEMDLAAPTEEDQRVFHLAPAFKYPEGKEIRPIEVVCVGAGMAGIYTSALFRWRLKNFNLTIYERNPVPTGTWWENKYPGVRCDVPSMSYCWRWEPHTNATAEYIDADELEKYFRFMVDKYMPKESLHLNTTVKSCTWHEDKAQWEVVLTSKDGQEQRKWADFLINGSGILHSPNIPEWPGMSEFKGRIMHSARYDRSVDLTDKVVAVVGNGSSGIGIIGTIHEQVKKLIAFQRKNTWIVAQLGQSDPTKLNSQKFTDEQKAFFADKQNWYNFYKNNWLRGDTFYPMFIKGSQMSLFATAAARILLDNLIPDPALREHLTPSYPVGCRRVTPHEGYFAALQSPKTELVKIEQNPIVRFTSEGIVTADGVERKCDHVILATGFHVTYRPNFTVTGRDGKVLQEMWKVYPEGYKSVMVSGMPNYFNFFGPIAPVASNLIHMIEEQQCAWFTQAIGYLQTSEFRSMEPKLEAQSKWNEETAEKLKETIWNIDCGGWYRHHATGRIISHYPGPSHEFMEMIKSPIWEEMDLRK